MFNNSYDPTDTPTEAALRSTTANLRQALRDLIGEAQGALARLDEGQRPGYGLGPGRVLDARAVNGYAAQFEALLSLPWEGAGLGTPERADEIVRHAGRA